MEDKIQENNIELETEEKVSINRKIGEFIVSYVIANSLINIIFLSIFYILDGTIETESFGQYVVLNIIINIFVIAIDVMLTVLSINVLNKLYFRTLCNEHKQLNKVITSISILGLVIGIFINEKINNNIGISGAIYVHYVHYILMTIKVNTSTMSQYIKMCRSAGVDELREKHNITKKTDWI